MFTALTLTGDVNIVNTMRITANKAQSKNAKPATSQYHHGDLRNALLEAALNMLTTQHEADLTLRALAAKANVSATAVYRHFANKDALLAALATDGFIDLGTAFGNALLDHATSKPKTRLDQIGKAYINFALKNPQRFRVMFGRSLGNFGNFPELKAAARTSFTFLTEAAAVVATTSKKPEQSVPFALAAWSIVHGYAILQLDGHFSAFPQHSSKTSTEIVQYLQLENLLE
jgi:AcrR family transcriptional regulator